MTECEKAAISVIKPPGWQRGHEKEFAQGFKVESSTYSMDIKIVVVDIYFS